MADVETLARRAGAATRAEAAGRATPSEVGLGAARRRRDRRRSAAAGALVVGLVVGAGVVLGPLLDDGPRIDAIGAGDAEVRAVLDVPPDGGVVAAWLDDGTPVLVSSVDDDVVVFDAVLDASRWVPSLVAYCDRDPVSGRYQDPRHGGTWDARGRWLGGPVPADLGRYELRSAGDGRVEVLGSAIPAEGRSEDDDRRVGLACFGTGSGDHPDDAIRHRPEAGVRRDARDLPAGRWTWIHARVAVIRGELRVCDDRCVDEDPALATPVAVDPPTDRGLYLARPTEDGTGVELLEQVVAEDAVDLPPPPDERPWLARAWSRIDPLTLTLLAVAGLIVAAVVGPVRQRSTRASGGRPRGPRGPSS